MTCLGSSLPIEFGSSRNRQGWLPGEIAEPAVEARIERLIADLDASTGPARAKLDRRIGLARELLRL